jgi:amino acid adenylation domain-containing protein
MKPLLQMYVTRQAQHRPEAVALVLDQRRITYGQLEQISNRLARLLQDSGCRTADRVCLLMPKSPEAIITQIAILKAGCMYVPIDAVSPASRIAKILASCEPRSLLAAGPTANLLDELKELGSLGESVSIGWMSEEPFEGKRLQPNFMLSHVNTFSADTLNFRNRDSDGAHILFTSGSTGTPKGVVITHRNVVHFVEWAVKYFGFIAGERHSGHPPLHFDLSTFDIFGSFASGAELHLVPARVNLLPNKQAEWIRASRLTQWFSVPSALNYMAKFDVVKHDDFPTLRRLLWCGEAIPTPTLIYLMRRLPHVTFTNLYGPTETTIASSYYTVPACPKDVSTPVPIGVACKGEELLVLDKRLRRVPRGEIGDLYIRGVGLSPGYWRSPEKTCAVFLPNPENGDPSDRIYKTGDLAKVESDGLVYYLGRSDSQIKSRGYRIELGEIETALHSLDSLRECAVVAIDSDGFEGKTICCAYVCRPDFPVTAARLRARLSVLLPGYMLPARWTVFEALPHNANGKVDRAKLRELFIDEEKQLVQRVSQEPECTLVPRRARPGSV